MRHASPSSGRFASPPPTGSPHPWLPMTRQASTAASATPGSWITSEAASLLPTTTSTARATAAASSLTEQARMAVHDLAAWSMCDSVGSRSSGNRSQPGLAAVFCVANPTAGSGGAPDLLPSPPRGGRPPSTARLPSTHRMQATLDAVAAGSAGLRPHELLLLLQSMSRMEQRGMWRSADRGMERDVEDAEDQRRPLGEVDNQQRGACRVVRPSSAWWQAAVVPPLSRLELSGFATLLERFAEQGEGGGGAVPEPAMAALGTALELRLSNGGGGDGQDQLRRGRGRLDGDLSTSAALGVNVSSLNASGTSSRCHEAGEDEPGRLDGPGTSFQPPAPPQLPSSRPLLRLLLVFPRVGRRPPHSAMNLLLAALQPGLPGLPTCHLAACLGALSRLQYVPMGPAAGFLGACLEQCHAQVTAVCVWGGGGLGQCLITEARRPNFLTGSGSVTPFFCCRAAEAR